MPKNIVHTKGVGSTLYIVIHGAGEGIKSEYTQYLLKRLEDDNFPTLSFDFNYITNGVPPSIDKKREEAELYELISDYAGKNIYSNFVLIGKSMGGVLSLRIATTNIANIKAVIILGFPLRLGVNVDLSLLQNNPFVPALDYLSGFSKTIKNVTCQVLIIQGKNDLLGTKDDIDWLIHNSKHKNINVQFIENATHSFGSLDASTSKEENYDKSYILLKHHVKTRSF